METPYGFRYIQRPVKVVVTIKAMRIPATHQDWLKDVQDAYASARYRFGNCASIISSITELFKVSALIAAERRGIVSSELVERMNHYVMQQMETDLKNGAELSAYQFHFVISYIHAHTPAGIIDEMKADRIMAYVNGHWDLFERDA